MDIKVPEVGESVFEALVATWHKKDGERVAKDDPLCEIETDKITLELNAESGGVLSVKVPEGTTVRIGTVIGVIDETGTGTQRGLNDRDPNGPKGSGADEAKTGAIKGETAAIAASEPVRHISPTERKAAREEVLKAGSGDQRAGRSPTAGEGQGPGTGKEEKRAEAGKAPALPFAVRTEEAVPYKAADEERITRKPMTPIRRRIAERLLAARQQTAMLTSFNEADMSRVVALREKRGDDFRRKHGVKLGFMPFFVRACVEALREFPAVNARIDGDDVVYQHFYDIGIAVSDEKGLVVPVLRNADRLRFAEIEKAIEDFTGRISSNKLAIADLEGGTFTITNGGVFGSLLSTPILNPPQSGVLGMHAVQERPVARGGKVVIRPMMYLALSYDHRLIDGREAVQFLKKVKEYIEEPDEMLLEG
jgi:2-oxoglutarate dehydrogenase E2 component (dihydrolipoamide succinyltransferase)